MLLFSRLHLKVHVVLAGATTVPLSCVVNDENCTFQAMKNNFRGRVFGMNMTSCMYLQLQCIYHNRATVSYDKRRIL